MGAGRLNLVRLQSGSKAVRVRGAAGDGCGLGECMAGMDVLPLEISFRGLRWGLVVALRRPMGVV